MLAWWRGELQAMYAGQRHSSGVCRAGRNRASVITFPIEPFDDLIKAFEQDQTVTRYRNFEELFEYCRYSANPVGRLVLGLCGYRDAARQELSDATCTALQLANFWQDVTVDLEKDRVYLPLDVLKRHGYPFEVLIARRFDARFRAAMKEAVDVRADLFLKGLPLAGSVDRRLAIDLELFSRGGCKVLEKIEQQDYDVLRARPSISKVERVGTAAGRDHAAGVFPPHDRKCRSTESYAWCERVARTQAKNFYYSFLLLTPPQRHAMCAIYAFMRYCDDLSDDEGIPTAPRPSPAGDRSGCGAGRQSAREHRCGPPSSTRWSATEFRISISST